MRRLAVLAALVLSLSPLGVRADPVPAAVGADPPGDPAHPAAMTPVAIPSHGVKLTGVLYSAAGPGPHPTVLLLHGLPGFEENLDLAQAMRRDGWNVLTLHYRGAWGSPGGYTFSHCMEDALAALTWLRDPDIIQAPLIDPAKIVVVGHSFGGAVAAYAAAHDPQVMATALISAVDPAFLAALPRKTATQAIDQNIGGPLGLHVLAGASADALAEEMVAAGKSWGFAQDAKAISGRPLLIVTADDGYASQSQALADTVETKDGAQVQILHLSADHSYSGARIALEAALLRWLENLPGAPAGM